ncbi:hypothetical protein M413DRAFT_345013 [Hebeloma cylindrosporum]|uniref:Uncharacterized protein n=1 Tax=Hebeloma cylindrosporum TaxID=76867 RepID=A0A0C3CA31_HEBCY|nr:hypothetical protein M413DRAFT_345013 [Hebeloma cylindrosporum h7]
MISNHRQRLDHQLQLPSYRIPSKYKVKHGSLLHLHIASESNSPYLSLYQNRISSQLPPPSIDIGSWILIIIISKMIKPHLFIRQ